MRYSAILERLQNLINYEPTQAELCEVCGIKQSTMSNRANRDSEFARDEIVMLNNHYGINLFTNNTISKTNELTVTIDYFPDVCGSCGNGVFQFSVKKEQITVPQNAFFKKFSPVKKYFVINAYGNSMEPVFYDKDKLIVQQWEGEQIIDNKPYLFCYKDEIFIKKLAKNVDQLIIIPENKDYDIRKLEGKQLEDVNIIGLIVGLMRDLR
jgi:phage repressor protein C with HTH and peptisase S24 domain